MVLSYSSVAKPNADTPKVINIASAPSAQPASGPVGNESQPEAGPSTNTGQPEDSLKPSIADTEGSPEAGPSEQKPRIQHLILDAGPLLSFTPLRHLAQTFHTTPAVVAELRDPKAREHWERLKLGMDVRIAQPSPDATAKVVAFARKTGDIAVLSQTDLGVIALTYQYEALTNGEAHIRTEPKRKGVPAKQDSGAKAETAVEPTSGAQPSDYSASVENKEGDEAQPRVDAEAAESATAEGGEDAEHEEDAFDGRSHEDVEGETSGGIEDVSDAVQQVALNDEEPSAASDPATASAAAEGDAPSADSTPAAAAAAAGGDDDDSDGGEWITPSNVQMHRSRDLGLVSSGGKADSQPIAAACMTGDFAVQNVLLGMGLGLVGEGGKRIAKVKSFVLRCHACFKICKDASKRFCPSCGNATLMRTTVTTDSKGGQHLHLKKNFQYHLRGTKYSIPDPKMGRAKGQSKGGSGLILREDQAEWSDAVRKKDVERRKEEKKIARGALDGWNDPDWMPEIIAVGMSGKGRQSSAGMPAIGHGRKNPNQARRKR